jgi:hypothetical protein
MRPEAPHPFSRKSLTEHYTEPVYIFSCRSLNVNYNFIILLRLKSSQLLTIRTSENLCEFLTITIARTTSCIGLLSFAFGDKYKLEILRSSSATHLIASLFVKLPHSSVYSTKPLLNIFIVSYAIKYSTSPP